MKGTFPINKFRELRTPFYYYDTKVLRDTLSHIRTEVAKYGNYSVHYAVKANANPKVLAIIRENCLGADCVSGGEIRAAIKAGFPTDKIVLPGSVRLIGKLIWDWIMTFFALMWNLFPNWRLLMSWLLPKAR